MGGCILASSTANSVVLSRTAADTSPFYAFSGSVKLPELLIKSTWQFPKCTRQDCTPASFVEDLKAFHRISKRVPNPLHWWCNRSSGSSKHAFAGDPGTMNLLCCQDDVLCAGDQRPISCTICCKTAPGCHCAQLGLALVENCDA